MTGCACGDQVQEVWYLAWPSYAITHAHNIFFTTWMNYPKGANLATNTSFPLLGVIGTPITLLFGPVATYNVLLRLSLVLSALAMCLVLRRWTTWWPAAFFGGLLYGFSPVMAGQGFGHIFLTFAPIPPLIVLVVDEIVVRRRRSALVSGGALGLLVVAQFLVSPEVLLMTVITVSAGVVLVALANIAEIRSAIGHVVRAAIWAGGIAAVLLAYPVWVLVAGPEHINGSPHPLSDLARYPGDLLGAVVPTELMRMTPMSIAAIGDKLTGKSLTENGMYLGIPLLLFLVFCTIAFRRYRPLVLAVAVAVVAWVLSLGHHATLDTTVTSIPLPFAVLARIPFVQDILPVRFSLLTSMYVAIAFAMGLDQVRRWAVQREAGSSAAGRFAHRARSARSPLWVGLPSLIIGVVVAVSLLPRATFPVVPTNVPTLFSTPAVTKIPAGSTVVTYPYPVDPTVQGMLDQSVASMRYKITGGYAFTPGPGGVPEFGAQLLRPPELQNLFYAAYFGGAYETATIPELSSAVPSIRQYLTRYHVSTVVLYRVGADPRAVIRYLTASIGRPTLEPGVVVWFDVAARIRSTASALSD
jgi:hypothetical protein